MMYESTKEYNLWFQKVSKKLLEWSELKPNNKDLENLVRGMAIIGVYNAELEKEYREIKHIEESRYRATELTSIELLATELLKKVNYEIKKSGNND